ncbi:MAG: prepilin-type N-terminal cleavage/methylation domain-containing protein [Candidatus Aminicenantales bacterium]
MNADKTLSLTNKKRKGYGLIEVLLSMALVAFFITGTAEIIIYSLQAKRKSETNIKAAELLASKLEALKSSLFESEALRSKSASELIGGGMAGPAFRREWKIDDVSSDMKRISIEISPETGPHITAGIVLLISRHLGF